MTTTSEARALPFFTDLIGQPLSSGFIYIGQAGLDPLAYPAVVTADTAGAIVVAQPVRTTNGHATQAGALIHLFCPIPYSITILDSAGRVVYTSLNETDPVALSISASSVQSADSLTDLRSRDRNSTNQVWVTGYGMYVYDPTDTTSPEVIPLLIVGNDGARYALDRHFVEAKWVNVNGTNAPVSPGAWLTWNDVPGNGQTYLTTNDSGGGGGHIFRNVNADGVTETGRVSIDGAGNVVTTGGLTTASSITAKNGTVNLIADGSRAISYNAAGSLYTLPGADLQINGALALTPPKLAANQQSPGVGALALGNSTGPQGAGPFPGTWVSTGTNFATVFLWVRSV